MTVPSFDVGSTENMRLICQIVARAGRAAKLVCRPFDAKTMTMDLCAAHANNFPIKFDELLAADEFDFYHDVFGIEKHINRETGKLENCFVPRCALQ